MSQGQLSVALLFSDLNEVKNISAVFKKLGIIPHFYEDLKTFWNGTLERIPSLCIVDVKLMSEGDLILRNHPHIQTEQLPIVFFYTNNTEPLLLSTYDFFHLGLLKKADQYESPLLAVLKRLNHVRQLEQEIHSLKNERDDQCQKIDQLKAENLKIAQTDQYQSMVKNVCLQLEEYRGEADFFKTLENVFQGIDEIAEFAMMELNFNGQKLLSPLSHASKFRSIPSLWLGQACPQGIELFAQNMATQVAIEIMGGDLVSLLIKGNQARPDKIMFVKSKNELFFNNFDWFMLEAYLNGFYASFKNKLDRGPEATKKLNSSFEAMSFLDQFLFGTTTELAKNQDYRLVDLDLSSLIDIILKKNTHRFFWNKFEKEFINRLEIQTRVDFKVFEFGVHHLTFLVLASELDVFFEELKDFSSKFAYWKYFEDSENVISQMIKPKVSMMPLSAFAYLQGVLSAEKVPSVEAQKKAALRTRELIWGRETSHEV